MKNKEPLKIGEISGNKKIVFDDSGKASEKSNSTPVVEIKQKKKNFEKDVADLGKCWYKSFEEHNSNERIDIKDSEMKSFQIHCKECFEEMAETFKNNNPTDAKWLETALHKGTAKDRANAGALLVQANPLANLAALELLISLTKFSNKSSTDVLETVTELFMKSLLPAYRKLYSLQQRGNDWKALKSNNSIDGDAKREIYAYWHFENELKDKFNSFLLNLQAALQNGKEINKVKAIISTSNLLRACPERESFLLSMLVNKFGDPDKKIASKATYHLRQILLTHPNMAHHMILETEKLIFRNNINELAQHYGIGFLSLLAPIASASSSQKLVDICFCFFKVKIEKGDINSKTMQSILNCLRIAIKNINDLKTENTPIEIATPDVVGTIYRLIYLSKISIALQALSLLLQLVLVQNEKHDRFYNALYKKMIDTDIIDASNKITSLYFHIIHQSVHQDSNTSRAKAFLKRLLQLSLSFPPAKACGALVVVSKILRSRSELLSLKFENRTDKKVDLETTKNELDMMKFEDSDDDEGENYKDIPLGEEEKEEVIKEPATKSSWIHVQNSERQKKNVETDEKSVVKYDAYKRSAAYSGSEFTLLFELSLVAKYFHPTVQVFVENIIKKQNIKYFGDPLKDFSLTQFLERFSFKNPKNVDESAKTSAFKHQTYKPKGSRGQSVHLLTDQTCNEDERFIFEFLQRKREIHETHVKSKKSTEDDDENDDVESIGDDEFDKYLDSLGAARDFDKSEKEFDYLGDLQTDGIAEKSKKKGKSAKDDDEESDFDEWDENGEDESDDDENSIINGSDNDESGTDESIDEPMDSDESGSGEDEEEIELKKPQKKRKMSKGGDNLFAAVEDFSELIEKNTSKNQATLGEIFNKDKSSQKQLDWEQKRHNTIKGFKRKNMSSPKSFGSKKKKRF